MSHFRFSHTGSSDMNQCPCRTITEIKLLLLYKLSEEIRNNQKPSRKIPGLLNHLMSTHLCLCQDLILQNPQLPWLLLKLLSNAADAHITTKSKSFRFPHFQSCIVCYLAQDSSSELLIDPTQTLTFTLFGHKPDRGMNLQEKHKLNQFYFLPGDIVHGYHLFPPSGYTESHWEAGSYSSYSAPGRCSQPS